MFRLQIKLKISRYFCFLLPDIFRLISQRLFNPGAASESLTLLTQRELEMQQVSIWLPMFTFLELGKIDFRLRVSVFKI
jgi:hypothetical protein